MVAASRKDRVRLVTLIYRKPGTSFEDFSNYWANERTQIHGLSIITLHSDGFLDAKTFAGIAVVKSNLLSYEQVRIQAILNLTSSISMADAS